MGASRSDGSQTRISWPSQSHYDAREMHAVRCASQPRTSARLGRMCSTRWQPRFVSCSVSIQPPDSFPCGRERGHARTTCAANSRHEATGDCLSKNRTLPNDSRSATCGEHLARSISVRISLPVYRYGTARRARHGNRLGGGILVRGVDRVRMSGEAADDGQPLVAPVRAGRRREPAGDHPLVALGHPGGELRQ
jgi:hypothetical protein